MEKIRELLKKYREIIVYIIFGVLTTFVNWAVYTLFVEVFGVSIGVSNAVAWTAGVLFAFITNKIWVFRSKSFEIKTLAREFVSFVGARAFTGVLEIVGVPLLVKLGLDAEILGIDGMAAKLIVSVAVVILNYVFSKLFIFRKEKENGGEENNNS
ncbi:MAG: GtrA family protein [Ruminococcaceae bacterium]|nr:GtrA family protein [Oscillospiraceae bacterium]